MGIQGRVMRGAGMGLLLLLTGCAGFDSGDKQPDSRVLAGIDGVACVGQINSPPPGLAVVSDDALLQEALGASGAGELCAGQVLMAQQPVTVYRVWDSARDYTRYGSWWSFQVPVGPRLQYREDNSICPSWSELDRMSACTLKVGAKLVVGPGQSAQCKQMIYAKSAVNQVYIPNDARNNVLHVADCSEGVVWP
uniref:hypothetical protein n=1 Tax=Marinobacterium profundum TaxID=1714300 RepID=UPI000A6CFCD0|nr:hypothetical protein [Marinobacterium profundum]